MSENIFVDGIRVFKPHEKAPEFVKANLVITSAELTAWLKQHTGDDGKVRVDLKKSQKGELYLALNTYKKGEQTAPAQTEQAPEPVAKAEETIVIEGDGIAPSDLPF